MKKLIVFSIFLLCTACGFQPRGFSPLPEPLQHIYIKTADPYGKLTRELTQYFKLSGVTVAAAPAKATTILDVIKEETSDQLLSVSVNQQTRQYSLNLAVTFQLTNAQGIILVNPQTVSETRAFTIQSSQVLAGSNESSQMYQEMRRYIVYDIINRLSSREISSKLIASRSNS